MNGKTPFSVTAARVLPAAALVAIAVLLAWREEGSIASRDWAGYAVLGALVLAALAGSGAAALPRRWVLVAAGGLVALAGWDAVALAWSPSPALGRDEALLTVLYAVVLLVPAVGLRTAVERLAATALLVAGLGGVAVAGAVELVRATDAHTVYYDGRLAFPIGYPNAQAAFFLVGAWPGLALAAKRSAPRLLRALALGAATALVGGWALAQSKGGALGLAASTLVVFAVHRRRLRLLIPFTVVAALNALAFTALTAPYRAAPSDALGAIHRAGRAELVLAAAGLVAGACYAALDRRFVTPAGFTKAAGRAVAAALVIGVIAACAVFFARVHDPRDYFASKWDTFKHLPTHRVSSSHLGALGSNRYDFWRVALDEFAAHPIAGIGTRGFRAAYLQHRRSLESPARAHSVELDALAETGLVGLALLVLCLGASVASFARRARDDLVAVGALGTFACWLAHSSVDWTWTFPAIGIPVFLLVGTAAAAGGPPLRLRIRVPLAAGAVALALGAFGLPWLSARYVRAAIAGHGNQSRELDLARSLDPISTDPLLARWALAATAQAGIAPLVQAARMEPRSADFLYLLGRQQLLAGERSAARRTLHRALRLDPADPAIKAELAKVR